MPRKLSAELLRRLTATGEDGSRKFASILQTSFCFHGRVEIFRCRRGQFKTNGNSARLLYYIRQHMAVGNIFGLGVLKFSIE